MKAFTLVFVSNGVIDYETFNDVDALRDRLVERADDADKMAVFKSEPLPFTICREPSVIIGQRRGRKPAAAPATVVSKPPAKRGRPRRDPHANGTNQLAD